MARLHLFISLLLVSVLSVYAHGGHHDDDDDDASTLSPSKEEPDLRSKSLIIVKIYCLILVFIGTFIGGISPYFMKWNEGFLVLGTQFAGGVFLGTALMHFLSDSSETFEDLTTKQYPFAFMLASAGYLLTMFADCVISHVYSKQRNDGDGDVELQGNGKGPSTRSISNGTTSQSHFQQAENKSENQRIKQMLGGLYGRSACTRYSQPSPWE
uniref:Zinc transporter 11-like n=1 Tax=Nelumbo nucifera TaxID=4432 RepID=A0A822XWZ2_NELNU|nr:TPA_asm: hypothetical protein HUJ06_025103 [Nelumbo nucifera]